MQVANIGWDRLHDATLVSVTTEWASGETHVRVRLSEEAARHAEIHVTGSTLLRCSREQPWGPSVSINEVRHLSIQDGWQRLEIEIQSGDVIEIEGDAVELNVDVCPQADAR
ncbi:MULTISPECIES: hypothetical protein [Myxococcus]|uniref:hypothetical protein n=1 Tax=Myxococcus TaxID=32 RepID=UPI001141515D|nr:MULTISPECIES: hypothetical protein [Myxococcus]NOJ56380.1 hypothetical protein [Myxococcus xanthus]QPM77530.1 hypothetical protein I5Q59_24790 [Myxococcus xanthus]QVW66597.1 hypothetical protein JTM82_30145 [Myxococcus xanthus DZ2]UEO07275.1 hypothetical protein K1515_12645 [Myxococcus xanthus DZ2]UYI12382.1 hypothetical protein N3T43_25370 [Myxococcus xanthus]